MSAFDLDLLDLDDLLSDEERAVRDETRAFCAEHLDPFVEDWFWDQHCPEDLYSKMGAAGLLAIALASLGRSLAPTASSRASRRCDT